MSTFDRIRIIKRYLFVFVVAFEEVCKVEGIAVVSGVVVEGDCFGLTIKIKPKSVSTKIEVSFEKYQRAFS